MVGPRFREPPKKLLAYNDIPWLDKEAAAASIKTGKARDSHLDCVRVRLIKHVLQWAGYPHRFIDSLHPHLKANSHEELIGRLRSYEKTGDPNALTRLSLVSHTITDLGDVLFDSYPCSSAARNVGIVVRHPLRDYITRGFIPLTLDTKISRAFQRWTN